MILINEVDHVSEIEHPYYPCYCPPACENAYEKVHGSGGYSYKKLFHIDRTPSGKELNFTYYYSTSLSASQGIGTSGGVFYDLTPETGTVFLISLLHFFNTYVTII